MSSKSMMLGALIEVKVDTPKEVIDYLEKEYNATVVREGMDEDKREMWRKNNGRTA